MVKELRIKINPDTCEIEYEVSGIPGEKCTDITDKLVGSDEVVEQHHSDEYFIPLPVPEFVSEGDEDEEGE